MTAPPSNVPLTNDQIHDAIVNEDAPTYLTAHERDLVLHYLASLNAAAGPTLRTALRDAVTRVLERRDGGEPR